eukprot:g3831.t1
MSRWNAVARVAAGFLEEQNRSSGGGLYGAGGGGSIHKRHPRQCQEKGALDVSVVLYEDTAETVIQRQPLNAMVIKQVRRLFIQYQPQRGTNFSAAWNAAHRICWAGPDTELAPASSRSRDNVVCLFLSDGRPGDLHQQPPPPGTPIQSTYRRSRQEFKSAGHYLGLLRRGLGPRLQLHFVGIFPEGFPWLKALASRYGGTFHDQQMGAGEAGGQHPHHQHHVGGQSQDDEVQLVGVQSLDTVIREREARARASGAFIDLARTATSTQNRYDPRTSTMVLSRTASTLAGLESTFSTISTAVTTLRHTSMGGGGSMGGAGGAGSGKKKRRVERSGVQLESPTAFLEAGGGRLPDAGGETGFEATKMLPTKTEEGGIKFQTALGEKPNSRFVYVRRQPFAQGALRNVYRIREVPKSGGAQKTVSSFYSSSVRVSGSGSSSSAIGAATLRGKHGMVAKESRHELSYAERLSFHRETVECQERAEKVAASFRKEAPPGTPRVSFLQCEIYRINDASVPGGKRYLQVEPALDVTRPYVKYNSNNGFVLNTEESRSSSSSSSSSSSGSSSSSNGSGSGRNGQLSRCNEVAQAFSHYSFEHSGGQELIVDLQGVGLCLTDPQLHSTAMRYGRADLGQKGIDAFFKTHRCGPTCRALGLS